MEIIVKTLFCYRSSKTNRNQTTLARPISYLVELGLKLSKVPKSWTFD